MTIIIATSWDGCASISCDSAGTNKQGSQSCYGTKLRTYPFGTLGFSGSYAMLPWLDSVFRECKSIETFKQSWVLAEACRVALTEKGWENKGGKTLPRLEELSIVILSRKGKIWTLQSDFAILLNKNYAAVGSGYLNAEGAAEAYLQMGMSAQEASARAARVAVKQISTCGGRVYTKKINGLKQ